MRALTGYTDDTNNTMHLICSINCKSAKLFCLCIIALLTLLQPHCDVVCGIKNYYTIIAQEKHLLNKFHRPVDILLCFYSKKKYYASIIYYVFHTYSGKMVVGVSYWYTRGTCHGIMCIRYPFEHAGKLHVCADKHFCQVH